MRERERRGLWCDGFIFHVPLETFALGGIAQRVHFVSLVMSRIIITERTRYTSEVPLGWVTKYRYRYFEER